MLFLNSNRFWVRKCTAIPAHDSKIVPHVSETSLHHFKGERGLPDVTSPCEHQSRSIGGNDRTVDEGGVPERESVVEEGLQDCQPDLCCLKLYELRGDVFT